MFATVDARQESVIYDVDSTPLYQYRSSAGRFTLVEDIYGFVDITSEGDEPAIAAIEAALERSGRFRREENDWRQYERRVDS